MREQDRAAPAFRVHAVEDMLEEGIIRTPLWRGAKEIAAPDILLPHATVPLLDGVRWIGEDHVKGAQRVLFGEGRVGERIAAGYLKILHTVDDEVHPRDGGRDRDQLLPVKAHRARIATAPLGFGKARDQHAACAAGRIVDTLARLRFQHLCHQVDQRAVGIEFLRSMTAVIGEFLDEIFVAVAELILGHGGQRKIVLGEVVDQVFERGVGHLTLVGPVGVAEDTLQSLWVGGLDG